MFIQTISAGTNVNTLVYDSKLYMALCETAGETFYKNRVDVTSGVSEVTPDSSSVAFIQTGEQTDAIVDDLFNIYFYTSNFQINQSTLP